MKDLNYLLLFLSLFSCASTMPGRELQSSSRKMGVTATLSEDYSTDSIHMIQFSLMNKTDEWIEIDSVQISSHSKRLQILIGDKITSWIEACSLEKEVSDYNKSFLFGSLVSTGALVAGPTQHADTSVVGAVVKTGSITVLAASEMMNSNKKVEFQNAFPDAHLFHPFVLPPKKVLRRWLLIENPDNDTFIINLKGKNKGFEDIRIDSSLSPKQVLKN